MSERFSEAELKSLHRSLWDPSATHWNGFPIFGPRDPMGGYRAYRRQSERVLSQNMAKMSKNTLMVRQEGIKISWVIDDKLGYLDKITTDSAGVVSIESLRS